MKTGAEGLRVDFLGAGPPRTISDHDILLVVLVLSELVAVKGTAFFTGWNFNFPPKKIFSFFFGSVYRERLTISLGQVQ